MSYVYNKDYDSFLLYTVIISLAILIITNIAFASYQYALEQQYDIKYSETKYTIAEYKENYSLVDVANSFFVKFTEIKDNAKTLLKKNILAITLETLLLIITFIPSFLMYQSFKENRKLALTYPTEITSIILGIEIIIFLLTCLLNIKESFDTLIQHQEIFYLIEDIFNELDSLSNSICFQITSGIFS